MGLKREFLLLGNRAGASGLLGRRQQMRAAMRERPFPLIDDEHRFMLLWSPKSACTTTTIWFFAVAGLADEAMAYDVWPHRYRQRVFYCSERYRRALADDLDGYTVLRVIRDPYSRAVSSYRHSLRTGYARAEMAALSPALDPEKGYSFSAFLDFLESEDLERCNPHHGLQRHRFETLRRADHVINVSRSDLFEGLNAFAASAGLPQTDFATLAWLHKVEGSRKSPAVDMGRPVYTEPFSRGQALGRSTTWPLSEQLLTPEARARVARLYAADLEAYGDYL